MEMLGVSVRKMKALTVKMETYLLTYLLTHSMMQIVQLYIFGTKYKTLSAKPQYPYLLTYLLTYSIVQSPSWEANWFAASQEIPRIFMEP